MDDLLLRAIVQALNDIRDELHELNETEKHRPIVMPAEPPRTYRQIVNNLEGRTTL